MSTFQPNKFQPIWRYIQKDITILSLVVGSSRKSENQGNKRGEKRGSWERIIGQKIFGGQQGDGRVFNTKFSKALHA
jgi:hypothetical protein